MSTSSLKQSFEKAVYCIHLPVELAQSNQCGESCFGIGDQSEILNNILHWAGTRKAYFITAYNPAGRQRDDIENRLAQEALIRLVKDNDWPMLSGYSTDREGKWPKEESVLVFCEDEPDILELARQFGQAAICRLELHQAVRLIMLE